MALKRAKIMISSFIPTKSLVAAPRFKIEPDGRLQWPPDYEITPGVEAMIPAFDRSFHFGDSLYEVTRTYDGVLFALEEHLSRLKASCELANILNIVDDEGPQSLRVMIANVCKKFFFIYGNQNIYLRITISAGLSDLNIDRKNTTPPYFMLFAKSLEDYPAWQFNDGLHYAFVDRPRNLKQALDPAMKSGNYLNNVLGLAEAKQSNADDAIFLNAKGQVTEGSTNNVYFVKDGSVHTPHFDCGILAGITRAFVGDICKKRNIPFHEGFYAAKDFFDADEVFMSSATKEIMPINRLNGNKVGTGHVGPLTKQLQTALRDKIAEYVKAGTSLYV